MGYHGIHGISLRGVDFSRKIFTRITSLLRFGYYRMTAMIGSQGARPGRRGPYLAIELSCPNEVRDIVRDSG
jgi:hypothetical protein